MLINLKTGQRIRIRITVNDGESALNTTPATLSAPYVLDTKNPALGGTPILINGDNPSTVVRASILSLSSSDDSTFVSLYAAFKRWNSSFGAATDSFGDLDNAQGSTASQITGRYAAYGASKSWTLWTPKLTSNIDASVITIPLTSTAGLPASGWIKIDIQ